MSRSTLRDLGVRVELHVVEAPVEDLWRRIEERNAAPPWDEEPITRSHLDRWVGMFERPGPAELALFDPAPELQEGEQSEIVGPSY